MDPGSRIAINYGVYGVPETFFIDRTGQIRRKHVGEIDEETLRPMIESLLEEISEPQGAAASRTAMPERGATDE
jgi:cytochrome c biogenesis protein CcmG/thiol:disulfide interchange protein DsbE